MCPKKKHIVICMFQVASYGTEECSHIDHEKAINNSRIVRHQEAALAIKLHSEKGMTLYTVKDYECERRRERYHDLGLMWIRCPNEVELLVWVVLLKR